MTGRGSQGRELEETIVDRSTDLASGCFSFSSTWCKSLLVSFSTCYLGILDLEGRVAPIFYRLYRLYRPKILVSAIGNITKCILVTKILHSYGKFDHKIVKLCEIMY